MLKLIKGVYNTIIITKLACHITISTLGSLALGKYFTTGDAMLSEDYLDMIDRGV